MKVGEHCENPEVLVGISLMEHTVLPYDRKYNANVSMLVHATNLADTRMILGLFVLVYLPPNVKFLNVGITFLWVCFVLFCFVCAYPQD